VHTTTSLLSNLCFCLYRIPPTIIDNPKIPSVVGNISLEELILSTNGAVFLFNRTIVIFFVVDAVDAIDFVDAVVDAVDDAVVDAVDDAVDEAVDEAVDDAVDEAVDDAVDDAVDAIDEAVDDAVDVVDDAVDEAVDEAVDDAIDAAVVDAIDADVHPLPKFSSLGDVLYPYIHLLNILLHPHGE
jgi:hypothetical protein